jgi:hypothetical protein
MKNTARNVQSALRAFFACLTATSVFSCDIAMLDPLLFVFVPD